MVEAADFVRGLARRDRQRLPHELLGPLELNILLGVEIAKRVEEIGILTTAFDGALQVGTGLRPVPGPDQAPPEEIRGVVAPRVLELFRLREEPLEEEGLGLDRDRRIGNQRIHEAEGPAARDPDGVGGGRAHPGSRRAGRSGRFGLGAPRLHPKPKEEPGKNQEPEPSRAPHQSAPVAIAITRSITCPSCWSGVEAPAVKPTTTEPAGSQSRVTTRTGSSMRW